MSAGKASAPRRERHLDADLGCSAPPAAPVAFLPPETSFLRPAKVRLPPPIPHPAPPDMPRPRGLPPQTLSERERPIKP